MALPERVPGISLREVLPEAQFFGTDDVRATSCCSDSRTCRAGDLFVALPGEHTDGHEHVAEAVARGAAAVVVQRRPADLAVPCCVTPDSRDALGRICHRLAGEPGRQLKLVGITGTSGKTTTCHLVAGILRAAGYGAGVAGTLGYCDGREVEPAPLTTPTPPVLARWLQRCVTNGCSHAVMEVSSHALVQSRVAGLELDTACVTNVRHDHLDFHGSAGNYLAAKARIFEHLLPEGLAVLNADCPASEEFLNCIPNPTLTTGIDASAEITARPLEQTISEQTFLLTAGSDTLPVRTPLIGAHNIANCLAAAAVGLGYGFELSTVVRGLESVSSIPGRLERIECGQPFGVFVDYAHTPDGLEFVLQTLRRVTRSRLICVFGAGGDRDRFKRPLMGRVADRAADLSIVTSDNPRSEDPEQIIHDVYAGFRITSPVQSIVDRGAAIRAALLAARPGDCVLIAGKGHEDYQIIGGERRPFDDRQFARDVLYETAADFESYRLTA